MPAESQSIYEIARQYGNGFAAALIPQSRLLSESDHWLAGYDDGYAFRAAKNDRLNKYLVSIGKRPMANVRAI
jgi:hypothetical protein